jgi:hypothetical protein
MHMSDVVRALFRVIQLNSTSHRNEYQYEPKVSKQCRTRAMEMLRLNVVSITLPNDLVPHLYLVQYNNPFLPFPMDEQEEDEEGNAAVVLADYQGGEGGDVVQDFGGAEVVHGEEQINDNAEQFEEEEGDDGAASDGEEGVDGDVRRENGDGQARRGRPAGAARGGRWHAFH